MRSVRRSNLFLLLWCMCAMPYTTTTSSSSSVRNMFSYTSCYSGTCWGTFCLGYSDYMPTCGWTVIVSSSKPLTDIIVYTATKDRIDDYTFHLHPMGYNSDLSLYQLSLQSIGVMGTWSNPPEVAMSFYCVCLPSSVSACDPVPYLTADALVSAVSSTITTESAVETTTPESVTTATTSEQPPPATTVSTRETTAATAITAATAATAATAVTAATAATAATAVTAATAATATATTAATTPSDTTVPVAGVALGTLWTSDDDSSSIVLRKVKDKCYTGTQVATSVGVRIVESCGGVCLDHANCKGVNFLQGDAKCFPVVEEVEDGSRLLSAVSGCQYWRVIRKS